ncbi:dienelactone hydrolase family protein [Natronosporangium hydrolyticum]|uniref:Dienelactone hydrolase family protein n=1 Tax=Natronosporangium hydrolyticum TaxID=2811111 RepID=A0A895YD79_9ACTN|nr:dienelactone hydrolase family protein [Natronosporangium hydrolyticum]QSB14132.1 dienelactone hydrolase family protein [Natronosporangium hydrolyticum]
MGEMVSYPSDGATSEGYLALPRSAAAAPGVIVIQEWWGLVSHITTVADRFADAGYVALAPDLFHGATTTEPDEARTLLMGLAMDTAARDIGAAADYLAGLPQAQPHTGVAAVGFCMGGSLALWSATLSDRVQLAVGFYPTIPWERMRPEWPEFAGKTAVIHCSEADGSSQAPGIQTARGAIVQAGGECDLYDYPGTKHAFFNDDRPEVFDPEAAASAWARTLDALRTRLG